MAAEADRVDTETLLDRVARGDPVARGRLLNRHRGRLKRMVAVRLDPRLAARLDPSDIVQDALADAALRLDAYARERPLPFYPWLRRFAWERLVQADRRHRRAARRSVAREQNAGPWLPEASAVALVERLAGDGTSPSRRLLRREDRAQVRAALDRLDPRDREVLVMRYLEQLSMAEIAAALGLGVGAVKMRHLRALQRLRDALGAEPGDFLP
jgi:RNA polymerase sigma-70 factor (ECF subfamily)